MIITAIKDISPSRKAVSLTVPAETLAGYEKQILKEFAGSARIPGFRPGKVPPELLKRQYSGAFAEKLNQKVLEDALEHIRTEGKLELYALLPSEDLTKIAVGADASLTLTVDITPEFQLPDYKGLDIPAEEVTVTDEEIQKEMDGKAALMAKFESVDRAAEKGDFVKFGYAGTIDGVPVKQIAPDAYAYCDHPVAWEEAGNGEFEIPEIATGIIGKKTGEETEVAHEFPDDFKIGELRGKKAAYTVKILDVRAKVLPELNEAFFKEIGVENLEGFRESARLEISDRKNTLNLSARREKAAAQLVEKADFVPPETLVEETAERVLRSAAETFFHENSGDEIPRERIEEMRKESRTKAEKIAKEQIILQKIAKAENITVKETEMVESLVNVARYMNVNPLEFARKVSKDSARLREITNHVLLAKTLDFILDGAKQKQ